ncbi:unnamed protein product [Periconia digitata]|uniref:Exosome complex protein n=1 Tax=Periconia digitata TaxID=1303443 RepID=A0A9W4XPA1_9PLEO|nr:unnamed protein product [Periconia digitata]
MDVPSDLPELVEDFTANIDELADALAPLLKTPLRTTQATLPLLDKAKLNVLTASAIEFLIYNTLQASGADAKDHAVWPELARLKTYSDKIKRAENAIDGEQKPRMRVNQEAAARFVKHGLAGNEKYDHERAEREKAEKDAKERAKQSLRKIKASQKFNQQDEDRAQAQLAEQARLKKEAEREDVEMQDDSSSSSSDSESDSSEEEDDEDDEEAEVVEQEQRSGEEGDHVDSENEDFYGATTTSPSQNPNNKDGAADDKKKSEMPGWKKALKEKKAEKKEKRGKKEKLDKKKSKYEKTPALDPRSSEPAAPRVKVTTKDKSKYNKDERRAKKMAKRLEQQRKGEQQQQTFIPTRGNGRAPKSHSQTFNALLDGSFAETAAKGKKGGKK